MPGKYLIVNDIRKYLKLRKYSLGHTTVIWKRYGLPCPYCSKLLFGNGKQGTIHIKNKQRYRGPTIKGVRTHLYYCPQAPWYWTIKANCFRRAYEKKHNWKHYKLVLKEHALRIIKNTAGKSLYAVARELVAKHRKNIPVNLTEYIYGKRIQQRKTPEICGNTEKNAVTTISG